MNPKAGLGCAVSAFVRLVLPNTPPESFDANFWINYSVTHDEYSGITISDFTISNNSGGPVNVGLGFESGGKTTYYPAITVPNGFGNTELSDIPAFDGSRPLVIEMEYKLMVDMGSAAHPGPHPLYPPLIYHSLPSVTSLMQFAESFAE
ncbi:MAG: hypothetical protein HY865_26865 [Chloroflexi bacterium]|nr:hypothetical protein [Chloroflexota bacterium]